MIRRIIASILILVGALLLVMILTSGLLFPHVLGPSTLIALGAVLFAWPTKTK